MVNWKNYLRNQTTMIFVSINTFSPFSPFQKMISFLQQPGIPLNMFKIDYTGIVIDRNSIPTLRKGLPHTVISIRTEKIEVFWLDEMHKHQKDIIFFGIVGINPHCSCHGYNHYKKSQPQIIHVGETKEPNIYIVFIVYSDEVIRLRLVLNTSEESFSPRLQIMSIYSWNIRISDIPTVNVENVDDIIGFLEKNFETKLIGFR
jgi:hypothetical protein